MTVRPKFFCENCRKEVPSRAKICPHCGRFFSDVRCPRCEYSGRQEEFSRGCPVCGFLHPDLPPPRSPSASDIEILDARLFAGSGQKPKKSGRVYPAWLFPLIVGGMGLLLMLILWLYGVLAGRAV